MWLREGAGVRATEALEASWLSPGAQNSKTRSSHDFPRMKGVNSLLAGLHSVGEALVHRDSVTRVQPRSAWPAPLGCSPLNTEIFVSSAKRVVLVGLRVFLAYETLRKTPWAPRVLLTTCGSIENCGPRQKRACIGIDHFDRE